MNPFQGCDLQLEIDEVLQKGVCLPALFSGHTPAGEHYLVAHATTDATWVCAPITERALACVRSGRADLRAAFAHTATGTVDILTVQPDGHWTEVLKLCRDLTDDDLISVETCLPRCA